MRSRFENVNIVSPFCEDLQCVSNKVFATGIIIHTLDILLTFHRQIHHQDNYEYQEDLQREE